MKQATLILLLCTYAMATLGVGINQFYCCGQLKSINISLAHKSTQQCASENEKDGCCKTKYQSIKVKDNHVAAHSVTIPARHFSDHLINECSFEPGLLIIQRIHFTYASHAPPVHVKVPVYILNCTYRI